MPIPQYVARLNRVGLNRVTRHVAPWLPGFGVVEHRGRSSGRTYRTPVNVFHSGDGFVIALTYGSDADWVRNVLAAGEAELTTRRQHITVTAPRLYRDASRQSIPAPVRPVLQALGVEEFLSLQAPQ